jgi:hypothetical protein
MACLSLWSELSYPKQGAGTPPIPDTVVKNLCANKRHLDCPLMEATLLRFRFIGSTSSLLLDNAKATLFSTRCPMVELGSICALSLRAKGQAKRPALVATCSLIPDLR